MQSLLLLRKTPFLPLAYQDKWSSLKNRALDLIDVVAKKCCRIQAHAMKRRMQDLHSSQQLSCKPLYLTNASFYAESKYVTRESKVFKMLKRLGKNIFFRGSWLWKKLSRSSLKIFSV